MKRYLVWRSSSKISRVMQQPKGMVPSPRMHMLNRRLRSPQEETTNRRTKFKNMVDSVQITQDLNKLAHKIIRIQTKINRKSRYA
ncbi:hypothetical protein D3C81_1057520 [compost metagenome]